MLQANEGFVLVTDEMILWSLLGNEHKKRAHLLNTSLLIRSGKLVGVDGLRSGLGRRLLEVVVVVWSRPGVLEGLRRRSGVEALKKIIS